MFIVLLSARLNIPGKHNATLAKPPIRDLLLIKQSHKWMFITLGQYNVMVVKESQTLAAGACNYHTSIDLSKGNLLGKIYTGD